MKPAAAYIGLFLGTFVGAVAIVGGLFLFKPEIIPGMRPSSGEGVADSTGAVPSADVTADRQAAAARMDSTSAGGRGPSTQREQPAPSQAPPSSALPVARDLQTVPDTSAAKPGNPPDAAVRSDAESDSAASAQRKAMARLFDGMRPENAARILKDIDDDQVKQILLTVKKRQAAKILAALDPDRAARILR